MCRSIVRAAGCKSRHQPAPDIQWPIDVRRSKFPAAATATSVPGGFPFASSILQKKNVQLQLARKSSLRVLAKYTTDERTQFDELQQADEEVRFRRIARLGLDEPNAVVQFRLVRDGHVGHGDDAAGVFNVTAAAGGRHVLRPSGSFDERVGGPEAGGAFAVGEESDDHLGTGRHDDRRPEIAAGQRAVTHAARVGNFDDGHGRQMEVVENQLDRRRRFAVGHADHDFVAVVARVGAGKQRRLDDALVSDTTRYHKRINCKKRSTGWGGGMQLME